MIKLFILLVLSVFIYIIVNAVFRKLLSEKVEINNRLDSIKDNFNSEVKVNIKSKKFDPSKYGFLRISKDMLSSIKLSGLKISPEEFVLIWFGLVIVPSILNYVFTGSVIRSIMLMVIGIFAPPAYINKRIAKCKSKFEIQLGDALMIISNGLRAGFSFGQAIGNIAIDLPDPIGSEFKSINRELSLGANIEESLNKVAEKMESDDLKLLSLAVTVQQQVGGNLADIIDTISRTIRDRISIKRNVRTITSQGRMSGLVLGGLPIGVLILVSIMTPSYIAPLFNTNMGYGLLTLCAIMEFSGFLIIRKMINIKF